jgi:hypothetical protein
MGFVFTDHVDQMHVIYLYPPSEKENQIVLQSEVGGTGLLNNPEAAGQTRMLSRAERPVELEQRFKFASSSAPNPFRKRSVFNWY